MVDVVVERGGDRREQRFAVFLGKLGERVAIDDDRTIDGAWVEVGRPPLSRLDGAEGHVRVRSEGDGFDDAAVERLSNFGCRHGGRHSTERLHGFADATGSPHRQPFELLERARGFPHAEDVVLRQGRGHQKRRVPACEIFFDGGVFVDLLADFSFLFKRTHAEIGQLENSDAGVFVAVVSRAELCHFESADRDTVEILFVLRQTPVRDIQTEFSVRLLLDEFFELFDMLGEGASFAPQGDIPHNGFGERLAREHDGQGGEQGCGEPVFKFEHGDSSLFRDWTTIIQAFWHEGMEGATKKLDPQKNTSYFYFKTFFNFKREKGCHVRFSRAPPHRFFRSALSPCRCLER